MFYNQKKKKNPYSVKSLINGERNPKGRRLEIRGIWSGKRGHAKGLSGKKNKATKAFKGLRNREVGKVFLCMSEKRVRKQSIYRRPKNWLRSGISNN